MEVSIVVPCYNEESSIMVFWEKISSICTQNNIEFEIIFVDDGSTDYTLSKIKELTQKNHNIRYASLSRNFGKDAAILAGLKKVQGNYCAVMDVDLQDPPELLPQMLEAIKNPKIDCVETRRESRIGEPAIRSFFAKAFCKIMNAISNVHITDGIRDFRLMKQNVLDAVISIQESNRFSKGLFSWVGFKTICITYPNTKRINGISKWSFWSLFKYAANGIISFSTLPLYIPLIFGALLLLVGTVGFIYCLLYLKSISTPFYLFFITFMFGFNFLFIGFLGLYLAKIHTETQKRPLYIIREEN